MNLKHYLNIIFYRAYTFLKVDASSGLIGTLVWIVEPVLYLGAFYLIFSVLNIRGGEDAIPFLLPGLVVWKWFASSVYRGGISIESSAGVIQQLYIPKHVLLLSVLLSSFYQFIIVFIFLLTFFLFYGLQVTFYWLYLIPLVFIQFLLILGVAGVFSVFIPFLPELKMIIRNGLTLVFFLSGIFFEVNQASQKIQTILYLNPMAILVEAYRMVFIENTSPDWVPIGYVAIFSVFMVSIAAFFLKKWDRHFSKILSV